MKKNLAPATNLGTFKGGSLPNVSEQNRKQQTTNAQVVDAINNTSKKVYFKYSAWVTWMHIKLLCNRKLLWLFRMEHRNIRGITIFFEADLIWKSEMQKITFHPHFWNFPVLRIFLFSFQPVLSIKCTATCVLSIVNFNGCEWNRGHRTEQN